MVCISLCMHFSFKIITGQEIKLQYDFHGMCWIRKVIQWFLKQSEIYSSLFPLSNLCHYISAISLPQIFQIMNATFTKT